MLHLQHKSARKRLSLWLKLALISLVGHIAALTMLFFVYRGSTLDMALTVRAAQLNNTIDVVWVSQLPKGRGATAGKPVGKAKEKAPQSTRGERKKKAAATKSDPKTELKSEVEEKKKAKKKEIKKKCPSSASGRTEEKKKL